MYQKIKEDGESDGILFYTNQKQDKLIEMCIKPDQTTNGGTDKHIETKWQTNMCFGALNKGNGFVQS